MTEQIYLQFKMLSTYVTSESNRDTVTMLQFTELIKTDCKQLLSNTMGQINGSRKINRTIVRTYLFAIISLAIDIAKILINNTIGILNISS